jgi:hypothetical protein
MKRVSESVMQANVASASSAENGRMESCSDSMWISSRRRGISYPLFACRCRRIVDDLRFPVERLLLAFIDGGHSLDGCIRTFGGTDGLGDKR